MFIYFYNIYFAIGRIDSKKDFSIPAIVLYANHHMFGGNKVDKIVVRHGRRFSNEEPGSFPPGTFRSPIANEDNAPPDLVRHPHEPFLAIADEKSGRSTQSMIYPYHPQLPTVKG